MKKLSILFLLIMFFCMFLYPSYIIEGAENGLLLWYHSVFPTLFPFMIVSSMMIKTDTVSILSKYAGTIFHKIFHVSKVSTFAIICGLLCGYPMGAKITNELLALNKISKAEASYLLSFCNNTSPFFVISYLHLSNSTFRDFTIPGFIISMLSPVLCSQLFYMTYKNQIAASLDNNPINSHLSDNLFTIFHNSIMNSIESIVQIGGYIITFCVFVSLLKQIPLETNLKTLLLSSMEITNGIHLIQNTSFSSYHQWIGCLALSSFGGFCSVAQTSCIMNNSGVSMKIYTIEKLITASVTSLLAFLYLIFR